MNTDRWHIFRAEDGKWYAQYQPHNLWVLPSQHGPFNSRKAAERFISENA